jgi:hypothetical protein
MKEPTVARKIVANLLIRERKAKRLRDRASAGICNEAVVMFYDALWAEAHKAAEVSRQILRG